jgi:hypothetical protein
MEENLRRYEIRKEKEVEFKEKCLVAKLAATQQSHMLML